MAQVTRVTNQFWEPSRRSEYTDVRDEATTTINKTIVVPDKEIWELLMFRWTVVASGDAGNRRMRYEVQDPNGVVLFTMQSANNQIASATEYYTVVGFDAPQETFATEHILPMWSQHPILGPSYALRIFDNGAIQDGTQSTGTLTIAEACAAGDTFTVAGVTFTIVAALTGAENEILLGANEAATKTAINAALGTTPSFPNTYHNVHAETRRTMGVTAVNFTGGGANDDMVFTAVQAGSAFDAIATTETFAGATNVWGAATFGSGANAADSSDLHLTILRQRVGGHGF